MFGYIFFLQWEEENIILSYMGSDIMLWIAVKPSSVAGQQTVAGR